MVEAGSEFNVILVMPAYVKWWTDTVAGLATMAALVTFLVTAIITTVVVLLCRRYRKACFKSSVATIILNLIIESWVAGLVKAKRKMNKRLEAAMLFLVYEAVILSTLGILGKKLRFVHKFGCNFF